MGLLTNTSNGCKGYHLDSGAAQEESCFVELEMEHNHLYVQTGEGVRLFVRKLGHGVDTVIIPNAIYMEEDFERLSHTHTVILFDLRNRGRSDAVDDPAQLRAASSMMSTTLKQFAAILESRTSH